MEKIGIETESAASKKEAMDMLAKEAEVHMSETHEISQNMASAMSAIESDPKLKAIYESFDGVKDPEGNDVQERIIKFVIDNPGFEPRYNKFTGEIKKAEYGSTLES